MGILSKLFVIAVSAGGILWGVGELRLAGVAKAEPTRMTCRELGEKGAEENAHVLLTDFMLTGNMVYEHGRKSSDSKKWTKVWVPAVPLDSEYAAAVSQEGVDPSTVPLPKPVRVIVVSEDTENEAQLALLAGKDEVKGMVVNLIESLGHKEKELLEESYGDVSKAQIFHVGRKPANTILSILAIVAGAAVGLLVIKSFFSKRAPEADAHHDG